MRFAVKYKFDDVERTKISFLSKYSSVNFLEKKCEYIMSQPGVHNVIIGDNFFSFTLNGKDIKWWIEEVENE